MTFIRRFVREPAFINALQISSYMFAIACGLLAATGGMPTIVTGQIGPVLSVTVGTVLIISGAAGASSVLAGIWWVERNALVLGIIGYCALLVPTLYFAFSGRAANSTIWLIVLLELQAIIASAIRYRRIDWAYLNPAK